MALNPKRARRIVVYLNDREYADIREEADRFDKKPGEYIRFGALRDIYGSLRMRSPASNENDCADECGDEGDNQ